MKEVLFSLLLVAVVAKPTLKPKAPTCGYDSCAPVDESKINVHFVCHSHDDLGWLETVSYYYYDAVGYTIDSVITALQLNPERKFIQVETYFLWNWWKLQNDDIRQQYIDLVNNGQIEIINGGWSMNDEASTHYQSTIDQFTIGHKWLNNTIGKCAIPKTGWQIDPFGHSREQASIYTQMGFDNYLVNRIDFRDVNRRQSDKAMDLLWSGSANLGPSSTLFSSVLYRHYNHPPGFCFDIDCDDKQINDIEGSPDNNIEIRMEEFLEYIKEQSQYFSTPNILVTMGDDFKYRGAMKNYNNIDKLIKGFRTYKPTLEGKGINLIYSTPTCYSKAVHDYVVNNNMTLEEKTDDFFPYGTAPNLNVVGYFVSRPQIKKNERFGNNILQVSKQLTAFANMPADTNFRLGSAVGILQHHDAICGTGKEPVADDYQRIIHDGIQHGIKSSSDALTKLMKSDHDLDLQYCPLANISICHETYDSVNVLLYNPLPRSVSEYIYLSLSGDSWTVSDSQNQIVDHFITKPYVDWSFAADYLKEELKTDILIFKAELPPLGYKVYHVEKSSAAQKHNDESPVSGKIGFTQNNVVIDDSTGFIKEITIQNITVSLKPEIMYYAVAGNSDNWVFRPHEDKRNASSFTDKVTSTTMMENDDIIEIKQVFNNWISQVVRIYKDESFIEFDYTVGPLDLANDDKDIIVRFSTNLDSKELLYTDVNSREVLERKRNFRPTYEYTNEEPAAANYYPITTRAILKDDQYEFAVITDRSLGAASLQDGQVEIMINRGKKGPNDSVHLDDQEFGKGVMSRGSLFVTLGKKGEASAYQRQLSQRKYLPPWIFITRNEIPVKEQSFLQKELPLNLNLVTFEKWNDELNTYLLRLEHGFEKDEHPEFSKDVTVDLSTLFSTFTITSAKEMTLNGVVPIEEVERMQWPQIPIIGKKQQLKKGELIITLSPMQIRTFIVTVS